MSTESQQGKAASDQATWQAQLSKQLSGIALPELKELMGSGGLGGMLSSRDASGQMAPDLANKLAAQLQLKSSYDQAQVGSRENISYQGLRSGGGRTAPGAYGSAITSAATGLDRDRTSALRNLEFMSAQSSLKDYNQVLGLMGQGVQSSLGLAQGFSGASGAAIGGLSNQSQFGSVLGGAAAGAGAGAALGPWAALAGGIAGGVIGYGTSA